MHENLSIADGQQIFVGVRGKYEQFYMLQISLPSYKR